uniref:Uncharacterized protein n=1 Tax=Cacopsylla melanoneura TaxID=428564 RepID=A0A8D9E4G0_9HEMI
MHLFDCHFNIIINKKKSSKFIFTTMISIRSLTMVMVTFSNASFRNRTRIFRLPSQGGMILINRISYRDASKRYVLPFIQLPCFFSLSQLFPRSLYLYMR